MLNRIIYGGIAILALVTVVAVDAGLADGADRHPAFASLIRHGSVIPPALTCVILLGAVELGRLLKLLGHRPNMPWATVCCAVLMLSPWLCAGEILGDHPADVEGLQWQVAWVMLSALGTMIVHLRRGVSATAVGDAAATLFVVLYMGFLPAFAVQLRVDTNLTHPMAGAWSLLLILALVFASDIGALYVGRALGKRKLAPAISPGKSVAGFVGGIVGSVVIGLAIRSLSLVEPPVSESLGAFDHYRRLANEVTYILGELNLGQLIAFSAIMSISSQLGDLFESLIKRCAQVKDSSRLIPGMGGILDVIDGTLFAVPLAWFLLTRVWNVV